MLEEGNLTSTAKSYSSGQQFNQQSSAEVTNTESSASNDIIPIPIFTSSQYSIHRHRRARSNPRGASKRRVLSPTNRASHKQDTMTATRVFSFQSDFGACSNTLFVSIKVLFILQIYGQTVGTCTLLELVDVVIRGVVPELPRRHVTQLKVHKHSKGRDANANPYSYPTFCFFPFCFYYLNVIAFSNSISMNISVLC